MLVDIARIKVEDRIRKDFGDLRELAEDIRENGLINPLVVTPDHVLIAGERKWLSSWILIFFVWMGGITSIHNRHTYTAAAVGAVYSLATAQYHHLFGALVILPCISFSSCRGKWAGET